MDQAQPSRLAVVGAGRLGRVLVAALRQAGQPVRGPLGREADLTDADIVLLCIPDREIARAGAAVPDGPLLGHCSGATGLDALAPHEAFSLHPLMTLARDARPNVLLGAGCAVAGSSAHALGVAERLARLVGMHPFEVAPHHRVAYHASAALASNFLVALESAAERLAATAGVQRAQLVPLVRATVENWAAAGPGALTGAIARGDADTVAAQRAVLAQRTPDLLGLFDALVRATAELAARASEPGANGGQAPERPPPARRRPGSADAPSYCPEAVPA